MADFIISTETLQSFLSNGNPLDSILQSAIETINIGGKVIIQNEFINAPPEVERTISTLEELNDWKQEIDPPMEFFLFNGNEEICPVENMNVSGGERTYQRIASIGGNTRFIPSRPSPLMVTFTCNKIISTSGNYRLSNKNKINIPIIIKSISNNLVKALIK